MGDSVFKHLPSGKMVVVPRLGEREKIVLETHRGMGHYGVQRVLDRLQQNYWWRGMGDAVVRVIRACLSCARVKAGFRESGKELQPLPIRGMGYRWGVDFAGPLAVTPRGNKWILVCIEHFSKWVELIPLPSKSSANAARGLLEGVLSRYGAPGEVITDRGGEFQAEFDLLLTKHEITHRLASREHPQATICNSEEESETHGGGGGDEAMDCSRRRVLACIACASDRCNAIDTIRRNHVHNKLMEGLDHAHSLDANVADSTKSGRHTSPFPPFSLTFPFSPCSLGAAFGAWPATNPHSRACQFWRFIIVSGPLDHLLVPFAPPSPPPPHSN